VPTWLLVVNLLAVVVVMVLAAIATGRLLAERGPRSSHYAEPPPEVIVHVTDGMRYRGLMVARSAHDITLADATAYTRETDAEGVSVDGILHVSRSVIELVQEVA
jgi:hypothetical protein